MCSRILNAKWQSEEETAVRDVEWNDANIRFEEHPSEGYVEALEAVGNSVHAMRTLHQFGDRLRHFYTLS